MPEPRPYIELTPTTDELHPHAVRRSLERLASRLQRHTTEGLRARLRDETHRPAIEWLLVSDGADDTRIRWLVGTTDDTLLDSVDEHLRSMLPPSYELSHSQFHPERYLNRTVDTRTDEPTNVAGVQLRGDTTFSRDWLLPLDAPVPRPRTQTTRQDGTHHRTNDENPHPDTVDRTRFPLTDLIERLTATDHPTIYQVVCRPYGPWRDETSDYRFDLDFRDVTPGDRLMHYLFFTNREEPPEVPKRYQERIDQLERRAHEGFLVAARAVTGANTQQDATRTASRLADGVDDRALPERHHRLEGHVITDDTILDDLVDRHLPDPSYHKRSLPLGQKRGWSPAIVMTAAELPSVCLIDGSRLTPNGERALATRPDERTGLTLPPREQLAPYQETGMNLGVPLTHDRNTTAAPISLPESFQNRHLLVAGASGAGKSVAISELLRSNTTSEGGPHVLFDYKGTDTARACLQTHFAEHGSLDDVHYFTLADTLPALSFFDIRPLLDAGLGREEARSRVANHYVEILEALMTPERFHSATHAGDIIRNHIRALFDPVFGDDAFSHGDLLRALADTRAGSPPPVADPGLETYFDELRLDEPRIFRSKLSGAIARVARINTDARLRPLFDVSHGIEKDDDPPSFSFSSLFDEDTTAIFDFGGMDTHVKNALTLALLSALWRALTRRAEAPSLSTPTTERSVVNLVLEEAGEVAATSLVDTLLREGRSFGLSVCLGVQYPAQLRAPHTERDTYHELLNEVGTFLIGSVRIDDDLTKALATDDMPPRDVATRLRALSRGEWLVRLTSEFGRDPPRPFLVESCPPPRGHPAGDEPLTPRERTAFEDALADSRATTADTHGRAHATLDANAPDVDLTDLSTRTSLLPHTSRLPEAVTYNQTAHALSCAACENRYAPTTVGMRRAIACCHSLESVDKADIPPCQCHLKLTPKEIADAPYSLRELLFIQSVYDAQQCRFDRLSYDIVTDSMIRLRDYVGLTADEVDALVDDGVIREERSYPTILYTVPPETRSLIGEAYREGVDFGDGRGDLTESSEHVRLVEASARWAEQQYVADATRPGTTVARYHELADGRRLDCAVLDDEGTIHVAIEAERPNNDTREAIPADFDTIAECDPQDAVWVVRSRADAHTVLRALNDPADGEPRIEKTYSETTPPEQWRIDTPGLTDVYTLSGLTNRLDELDSGWE